MSTFDDASLVFIPSGYKTSKAYSVKPIDGTGDLTFARSNDTATRVNSAGLIEKVRTNLLLQSNTFNTTWTASNASVTSGQAGYDGTNNAWLLSKSAANGYISQGPASSGSETISVYAKAGTDNWLHILVRDSASVFFGGYWDLQNGVVGSAIGATTLRIESVGNGWYRCSASFVKSTSNYYRIYPAEGNNDTSGTSGNILIQNAQLETGDIATQYIPTLGSAVSVGPVANVPRLDYLGSTCGKLILEPQRTNSCLWSENFDNAGWTKTFASIAANNAASPDGYTNADKLIPNTTLDVHQVSQVITLADNTSYAFSCFAKADGYNFLRLAPTTKAGVTNSTFFNLSNGTVGTVGVGHTASIASYGNGWYRCTIVYNSATGASSTNNRVAVCQSDNQISFAGNGTSGILIYGAQHELGSYSSSYVNTLGAAVTRGADACSKTGISSLIGQTQGTLFAEFEHSITNTTDDTRYILSDNTYNNWMFFSIENGTSLRYFMTTSAVNQLDATVTNVFPTAGRYKVAFAYQDDLLTIYVNGVQKVNNSTSTTIPATSALLLSGKEAVTSAVELVNKNVNQALLFKTRLSNSDLAALTTL